MLRTHTETAGSNKRVGFRPVAFIWAFFNPVSTADLTQTLNESRDSRARANETIKETDELFRKADEELAKDELNAQRFSK